MILDLEDYWFALYCDVDCRHFRWVGRADLLHRESQMGMWIRMFRVGVDSFSEMVIAQGVVLL